MHKNNLCVSLCILFVFIFCNTTTLAYPIRTHAIFTCPCANELYILDNYIVGLGSELILHQSNPVNFKTSIPQTGSLGNFINYKVNGINYDSTTGQLSCDYISNNPTEQPFELTYYMMNGNGGIVQAKSMNTISILLFIGLH